MAQLNDDEVDEIIRRSNRRKFTPRAITDPQEIREKVIEARENGYALASEEVLQGKLHSEPLFAGRMVVPCGIACWWLSKRMGYGIFFQAVCPAVDGSRRNHQSSLIEFPYPFSEVISPIRASAAHVDQSTEL
ncbi:IclR family transcriptional regulator C-terminal domain-containing protein [Mesorhizobium sp. SB112]|uniref:IclR family transcriptional regulator domain-containing protein n=1 Tax=Mesorhizobium sp. SB112 TaxID=3151853 RepID=UPI003266DD49